MACGGEGNPFLDGKALLSMVSLKALKEVRFRNSSYSHRNCFHCLKSFVVRAGVSVEISRNRSDSYSMAHRKFISMQFNLIYIYIYTCGDFLYLGALELLDPELGLGLRLGVGLGVQSAQWLR